MTIPAQSSPVDGLLERAVLDVGIPPCPAILTRFMQEARKDEPDYSHLATIIATDVSLSAGLIKTANSPFFGIRKRVRSVNEALTILGLKIATHAVAGIILRNSFPRSPSLERFWDSSARIAWLSGWLAQTLAQPGLQAEDAFTYGLFRDCGIPILLRNFPDYERVLAEANKETGRSFCQVESAALPTNHAMVGSMLAQSWGLPEEIYLAIGSHHDLAALEAIGAKLPSASCQMIATAQLAEHLVQHQLGLSMTQEWTKLGSACLKILAIDEARLERLYGQARPLLNLPG